MKHQLFRVGLAAMMAFGPCAGVLAVSQTAQAQPPAKTDFDGAKPEPIGATDGPVSQLKIEFPASMVKEANKEVIQVTCSPAVKGFSGWARNNTIWTYDFKAESDYESPRLKGGTKCEVKQTADIKAADGKVWKAGSIAYNVVLNGPNVTMVKPAHGFQNSLREKDPVVLITFDGPVDRQKFFANQNGSFNYTSSNAPSEKLALAEVPADQAEKLFSFFKLHGYYDVEYKDRNWVLATVKQSLIPGAQLKLSIAQQVSADNADVRSTKKFEEDFEVRSDFQAEYKCASDSAKPGVCMPNTPINVLMNGAVKWTDVKDAYIEYVPFKSKDGVVVKSYAQIEKERQVGFWDDLLNRLSYYFPWVAKYSDTVVDSFVFDVNIEPDTQAKIVLPAGLKDLDGRVLNNPVPEFHVAIAAMDEEFQLGHKLSFFEKNMKDVFYPVGIVNQNQKLSIRMSGARNGVWEPILDAKTMIDLIRAYDMRGTYRDQEAYTSPLDAASLPNTVHEEVLTGQKNRMNVLQFPFGLSSGQKKSGLYAIEISSPTFEERQSNRQDGEFMNPKYSLAQVTDLMVSMKRGATNNVAWITHLSDGRPAAGAELEIYNCKGDKVTSVTADQSGIAKFANQTWADDCQVPEDKYSQYTQADEFFAVAKEGDDQVLVHTSWTSDSGYAMGAPGIEYFYSNINENKPYFHAVIGVNLVKPGQQVPVELVAKLPLAKGFSEVAANDLPTTARVTSDEDRDIFYEYPIKWANGKATFTWDVPADSSVRLGSYRVSLYKGDTAVGYALADIEVAEFKIPLMTGIISVTNDDLVRPDSVPVGAVIRYANGVGAKKLNTDLSYYFTSTTIESKELPGFEFGNGSLSLNTFDPQDEKTSLPENNRPAILQNLKTGDDGKISADIAQEKTSDGRTVAEVLKSVGRPQHLVVRVRYQDQIGEYQTLSRSKDIFNSASYVGTKLVSGPRNDARLQAAAIDVKQKNITSLADLDLKLTRIESNIIGEELFGGVMKNVIERKLHPVRWTANCAIDKGVVSCPVGALKEGSYAFEAKSKTSKQASHVQFKVDTDGRVYNRDAYGSFGDEEEEKRLALTLNKPEYKNGERAVVSFAAPFKTCRALVTIERSDVIDAYVANDACQKGNVEVQASADLAPNAFVSVFAVTGRATAAPAKLGEMDLGRPTYRQGFANMKVDRARFKSKVAIQIAEKRPSKNGLPVYEPGETVGVAVQVAPEEGSLKGGSVTLVALEEKILELKPNESYNVVDAFLQLREHGVKTVTGLERIDTVVAGEEENRADAPRKGGNEGGDGSSKSEFKRKLFNALVAFQPNVPVQNGVAKFSFKANDSLTRFKVIAIATDSAQKFGVADAVYLSEKDTQSYSNIPSVARTGDKFPLKVTVQNNTGKDGVFKAEITAVVKDRNGQVIATKKLSKEQAIGKSDSKAIDAGDFDISDDAATIEYAVKVYDENGKLVDSMEPDAQKVVASVPLAVSDSFIDQVKNGSFTRTLEKDRQALQGKGEIRVSASKSLVSSALTQIGQRVDRAIFADLFTESKFQKALLHSSEAKPEEIKKVLETLVGQTDSEGFVKYFPQASRGDVYLTASILHALQQEPWTLKHAPPALMAKMKNAVSNVMKKSVDSVYVGKTELGWMRAQVVMARAAFVFNDKMLSENAQAINEEINVELARNPNHYGQPIEKWSNDELLQKWILEIFAEPAKAKDANVLKVLAKRHKHSGNGVQLDGAPSYTSCYSDETIETATYLLGVATLKSDEKLARGLAVYLASSNFKGWYNVSTMASVAQGLKRFGRTYDAEPVTGSSLVSIPEEQQSTSIDFDKVQSGSVKTEWKTNKATVELKHGGQGSPWVSIQALAAIPLTQPRGQGLAIEKSVRNITQEEKGGSGFHPGDIIEVTLDVNANGLLRHVAVLDPIPSGANIIGDATGSHSSGQKSYSGYNLYFETLPSGRSTLKYSYQLNNPGQFKLPPTRAEGLYMPSIFADAPNASMTIQ